MKITYQLELFNIEDRESPLLYLSSDTPFPRYSKGDYFISTSVLVPGNNRIGSPLLEITSVLHSIAGSESAQFHTTRIYGKWVKDEDGLYRGGSPRPATAQDW